MLQVTMLPERKRPVTMLQVTCRVWRQLLETDVLETVVRDSC